jgi:hypothetical protein
MDARRRVRSACRVMMINGANLEDFSQRMASAGQIAQRRQSSRQVIHRPQCVWVIFS